ncbi:hypothetical protein MMC25_007079 [Agyrium rufum]|nr:hypothetical protein [Agyrium rufum]
MEAREYSMSPHEIRMGNLSPRPASNAPFSTIRSESSHTRLLPPRSPPITGLSPVRSPPSSRNTTPIQYTSVRQNGQLSSDDHAEPPPPYPGSAAAKSFPTSSTRPPVRSVGSRSLLSTSNIPIIQTNSQQARTTPPTHTGHLYESWLAVNFLIAMLLGLALAIVVGFGFKGGLPVLKTYSISEKYTLFLSVAVGGFTAIYCLGALPKPALEKRARMEFEDLPIKVFLLEAAIA